MRATRSCASRLHVAPVKCPGLHPRARWGTSLTPAHEPRAASSGSSRPPAPRRARSRRSPGRSTTSTRRCTSRGPAGSASSNTTCPDAERPTGSPRPTATIQARASASARPASQQQRKHAGDRPAGSRSREGRPLTSCQGSSSPRNGSASEQCQCADRSPAEAWHCLACQGRCTAAPPTHERIYLRSDLKAARSSSQKSWGCSQAAKWPPRSSLL